MENFKVLFEAIRIALMEGTPVEQMPAIVQAYLTYHQWYYFVATVGWSVVSLVALLIALSGFWAMRSSTLENVYIRAWFGTGAHLVTALVAVHHFLEYIKVTHTPLLFLSEKAIDYFKQLAQAM